MPSRSRSAKRSSTSPLAPLLVAAAVAAALLGAIGLTIGSAAITGVGLFAGLILAGSLALVLIVSERRRHVVAEDELAAQASFARVPRRVDRRGFRDDRPRRRSSTGLAQRRNGSSPLTACASRKERSARGPAAPGRRHGRRPSPSAAPRSASSRSNVARRSDAATWPRPRCSPTSPRAPSRTRGSWPQAQEREAERERLTDQLVLAEQDERRRLSVWLHDGPLSTMSGVALMHDAALGAIEDGRYDDAAKVVATALERERETIRTLRDLSFALEPLVLRDQGFAAAVQAIGDQVGRGNRIAVTIDAAAGERLAEKAQVELYQVIREAVNQAVRRRPDDARAHDGGARRRRLRARRSPTTASKSDAAPRSRRSRSEPAS